MRSAICQILAATALLISVNADCNSASLNHVLDSITCGSQNDILSCLFSAVELPETTQSHEFGTCLENIGCSAEQASRATQWLAGDCGPEMVGELRKRDKRADSTTDSDSTTKDDSTTTADSTTAASTTDASTTTADSTTASTAAASSTTSASTASSTTSTDSTSSSTGTTTTSSTSSTTTGLVCFATSSSTYTWCATVTTSGSTVSSCVTTSTPISSCAPGLICATSSAEKITCMKRDDTLTTSGLVVSIAFGVVLAIMISSVIFMCCRSRRDARAQELARENGFLANAKANNDVESAGLKNLPGSEAHLPLMSLQGPGGGGEYAEYGSAAAGRPGLGSPNGSYQNVGGPVGARGLASPTGQAPKLHPGLMAAPSSGNLYDAEEDDVGYSSRR